MGNDFRGIQTKYQSVDLPNFIKICLSWHKWCHNYYAWFLSKPLAPEVSWAMVTIVTLGTSRVNSNGTYVLLHNQKPMGEVNFHKITSKTNNFNTNILFLYAQLYSSLNMKSKYLRVTRNPSGGTLFIFIFWPIVNS